MDYITHQLNIDNMGGIEIMENFTIYHCIFANDVGVFIPATPQCFSQLKDTIKLYETTSWAKLNLAKSVVIPSPYQKPHNG